MTALLATTYFGPVQWYQKLYRYDRVLIDQHESFRKQTFRNRCIIATTQGPQALTVPIDTSNPAIGEVRLSDHGNWRHHHWQALQSAYGESPFFDYYEDDLRPFFTERRWERLIDFNEAICLKMCELLDIQPSVQRTTDFHRPATVSPVPLSVPAVPLADGSPADDFREAINPKHPLPDPSFQPQTYYQVYALKHGFLPNLSILDLLLNMGPEAIFFL